MRLLRRKKFVIPAIVGILGLIGAGVAYGFFTSQGSGNGSAQVGTASPLVITQLNDPSVQYDSIPNPMPANLHSDGVEAYYFDELGSSITLANSGQTLNSVVVEMDSWGCQTGGGVTCATTPGATFPAPITLKIYRAGSGDGHAPGTLITSDTQTFNIRYRPSADPTNCSGAHAGQWDNSGTCTSGLEDNITFDNFSPSSVALPGTVVYGIAYNTDNNGYAPLGGSGSPLDSLNIAMASTGASNPSVGSDPDSSPPSLFIDSTEAASEFVCPTGSATVGSLIEYDVAYNGPAGPSTCGLGSTLDGTTATDSDVPAVEFITGGSPLVDLYPGGPYQPISFTIYNPGSSAVAISSVTITVTGTSDNADCNTTNFAFLNGVPVAGPPPDSVYTTGVPTSIGPGVTETVLSGATGAAVEMLNLNVNQDGCEGVTANLGFASS